MTPAQVEATKKSASDALQVAAKYILLKSFIISKTIIGLYNIQDVVGAMRVPEVQELANFTVKELINLTNLTIKKVEWYKCITLSFTLSNGEYCTAGSSDKVDRNHTFDPNKKITKVECSASCTRLNTISCVSTSTLDKKHLLKWDGRMMSGSRYWAEDLKYLRLLLMSS